MNPVSHTTTPIMKNILDAIPAFVFVVDEDVRIIEYNNAAAALLDGNRIFIINMRVGEALHCIHSHEVPEGCGRAPICEDCIIRNSVVTAYRGEKVSRVRTKIEIGNDGNTTEIFAVITASPIELDDKKLVLLLIEDISDLVAIQDIVPICMMCKKVRSVDTFWTALESYFKNNWGIDFSHGYCPECAEEAQKQILDFIDNLEKH